MLNRDNFQAMLDAEAGEAAFANASREEWTGQDDTDRAAWEAGMAPAGGTDFDPDALDAESAAATPAKPAKPAKPESAKLPRGKFHGQIVSRCLICARTLRDVVSQERSIGPVCWEKHNLGDCGEANRDEGNKVLYAAAQAAEFGTVANVREALDALRGLGFDAVADAVAERCAKRLADADAPAVRIEEDANGRDLLVFAPYSEAALADWRRLSSWDCEAKARRVNKTAKRALNGLLLKHFAGEQAEGPKGVFTIGGGSNPEPPKPSGGLPAQGPRGGMREAPAGESAAQGAAAAELADRFWNDEGSPAPVAPGPVKGTGQTVTTKTGRVVEIPVFEPFEPNPDGTRPGVREARRERARAKRLGWKAFAPSKEYGVLR